MAGQLGSVRVGQLLAAKCVLRLEQGLRKIYHTTCRSRTTAARSSRAGRIRKSSSRCWPNDSDISRLLRSSGLQPVAPDLLGPDDIQRAKKAGKNRTGCRVASGDASPRRTPE